VNTEARYALPLLALSAVTGAFFLGRRFRPLRGKTAVAVRIAVTLPLVMSGVVHLVRPAVFVALLPPPFPQRAWLIVLTGLPELLGAAGIWVPQTRRTASVCLAVFMIAIFPANIYVAGQTVGGLPMPQVPTRLAMQAVYIVLILLAGWGVPLVGAKQPQHP
jgi:uncharacterized membrane protein